MTYLAVPVALDRNARTVVHGTRVQHIAQNPKTNDSEQIQRQRGADVERRRK